MSSVAMKVTIVEPDIAPSTKERARLLGIYSMALLPRKGEMVSIQTDVGGPRLPYRVMDVVYNLHDQPCLVGDDVPDVCHMEATLVVCKIVTDEDLARATAAAVAGQRPSQRTFSQRRGGA